MAYDYDVDILGALFTGGEENEEPYVSFITTNGALTNEVSERRILSTIELLRSHMELIQTRDEANLLMYALARLISHTAGGSNPFSPASAKTEAIGNVKNPQFPAGANVSITFNGNTIPATSASGGDCATVAAELNVFLDVPGTPLPEMSTVLVNSSDAEGSLGGKFFKLNSANNATNYYVWLEHFRRTETTEITPVDDTDGDLAGTRFTINGSGDVGSPEEYYVWYSHDGIEEETEITVSGDSGGNRAGLYFTLNSPTTAFYVWYSHNGRAEVTDVTASADTDGDLGETYFLINSAGDATSYYTWFSHDGRAEVFTVTSNAADVNGSLGGLFFTLDSAGDATEYYAWLKHPGIGETFTIDWSGITGASLPNGGNNLIGAGAQDETDYDGAGSNGTFVGGDGPAGTAYVATDTITLSDGSVITVDSVDGDDDVLTFTVTTAGATFVTAGVALTQTGTSGTGLAFTLTPQSNNLVATTPAAATFDASTTTVLHRFWFSDGFTTIPAGGTDAIAFTAADSPQDISDLVVTALKAAEAVEFASADNAAGSSTTVTTTVATVGPATDATNGVVSTGAVFAVPQQGVAAAVDPAEPGTSIEVNYSVNDSSGTIGAALRSDIGGLGDFSTGGEGNDAIVTNAAAGVTTDAADGDTGFGFLVNTQGINIAETDPAPGGVDTGIEVMYSVNVSASNLAEGISAAVGGLGDFGASDFEGTVTITNAAVGATTNGSEGTSGFGISVTTQGLDLAETDPAPAGVETGIEVMYAINASSDSLAEGISAAVGGLGDFNTEEMEGVVTVVNAAVGATTDAEGGTSGFGISVTQQGFDAAETDPAPLAEGGIEISYVINDNSDALGLKTAEGVGGNAAFSAADLGEGDIVVTNADIGAATDATGGTVEWSISVTQQGLDVAETDPAPAEGTSLEVEYSVNASATSIAEGTNDIIDGAEGIGASTIGALVTTTTDEGGSVVDAADVDTGFAFDVTSQGLDRPADPAPFGLTGISVDYAVGGPVGEGAGPSEMATDIAAAVDANGDFDAIAEGSTVFADNVADGPTTDLTDGNTGFIFTVTQQGDDISDTIPVQAFCTIDGRLGFRSEEDFLSFTVNNGTGGIIGPAGIIPGPRLSTPARVANDGRNSATSYVSKKNRNNPLDG